MISGIFWLDLLQAITNPLQGFLNMILYGHHFFSKYKSYCCSKKKVKKVNSKSSLLSGESSETPLKQKSPDFSDKNMNEEEEIKFGVIYTERPKIALDSPSADNIVPKSVYYYHLDNHYDDDECSEEESAHYDNAPRTFLPNYFNNETPLYSSVASSGNQHGMRIIHQTQASSILSGPYFQNNNSRGNENNSNSYRNSATHDSLRQESIRMIPIAQSNSISGAYNTSIEYNARLDDILD